MSGRHWEAREFFTPEEFNEPDKMDAGLVSLLELARASAGVPFKITSSYREPDGSTSAHHLGKAVDIRAKDGATRYAIVRSLTLAGARRLGVYLETGHVHIDVATALDGFPQDVLWVGKGR